MMWVVQCGPARRKDWSAAIRPTPPRSASQLSRGLVTRQSQVSRATVVNARGELGKRWTRLKCRGASFRATAGDSRATDLTSRGGLGKLWDADDRESW